MEYSIENVVSFLRNIPETKDVFFTGGEPLLYDKLASVLGYLKENVNDISLGLFTTGIMQKNNNICPISEEYAQTLAENGLKVCYVSVYSHEKEKHDWITGKEGSFEATKKSIENFEKAGVEIRFNCVVTKLNKMQLADLVKLTDSLSVTEIRLLKLVKHGRATDNWEKIGVTEKEYRKAVCDMLKAEKRVRITASSLIDVLPCRPFKDSRKCQAGTKLLYVTYHGEVFPCASVKNNPQYIIGNLADKTIWKAYFGEKREDRDSALCNCANIHC